MALAYAARKKTPLAVSRPAPQDFAQRILNTYISQYLRSDAKPAKVRVP